MKATVTTLVFCVAALLALGIVMLYSSSMLQSGTHYLVAQLIWCGLGLILCGSATFADYRWLKKVSWPLLVVAVILLVLVFAPHVGIHKKGASRWLGYGKTSLFQPSEVAKLALILALATYGERYLRQMGTWKRGVMIPMMFIGVVLGLIFIEPDRGTTILMAAVSVTMLLVAGVRWRYILPPAIVAVTALAVSLARDPMRGKRIFSWLYIEETKSGVGYQAYQAMIALGAGGWTGLGLGNGRQKMGFVPEHNTDFIFSIIGEELGLIATMLIVVTFVFIVWCGIYIARNARDTFGLLLGCGLTFMIGFQAFINIGVVTSALPNKGMSLPFISYGGSNLLMMMTSVGLLLSIARRAQPAEAIAPRSANMELEPSIQPS